jgi:hypothetical protein
MLVKGKRAQRSAAARRKDNGGHGVERAGAAPQSWPTPRERRHGGQSEDRALYTCECGYAFEALVTTSVGCPHCARSQAW